MSYLSSVDPDSKNWAQDKFGKSHIEAAYPSMNRLRNLTQSFNKRFIKSRQGTVLVRRTFGLKAQ